MRQAQCCPVCGGRGQVDNQFYTFFPYVTIFTLGGETTCRSCSGTGVVWEPEKESILPPYEIYGQLSIPFPENITN